MHGNSAQIIFQMHRMHWQNALHVPAKAFIFLFIYTHHNQSQLSQLGGRKSDCYAWMDGWIYNLERRKYMIHHSSQASFNDQVYSNLHYQCRGNHQASKSVCPMNKHGNWNFQNMLKHIHGLKNIHISNTYTLKCQKEYK